MSSQLVLVTGVSGYVGSYVASVLLKQGYRVRGVVRSPKAEALKTAYSKYEGKVEIVVVDDLIKGDFTDALRGVSALIHVASPVPGRDETKALIDSAVGGTLNIIRQAADAGVKHISFTGSLSAFMDLAEPVLKAPVTDKDWNSYAEEQAFTSPHPMMPYFVSKKLAEQALWKLAEEYPDLNITTISPTVVIGPYAEEYILTPGNVTGFGTPLMVYNLLAGPEITLRTSPWGYVDIRDAAAQMIAGIKVTGKHRLLSVGPWFDNKEAVEYITSIRPDLKDRLVNVVSTNQKRPLADPSTASKVLGLPEPIPWRQTVADTLEAILKVEKEWTEKGTDIKDLKENGILQFQIDAGSCDVVFTD